MDISQYQFYGHYLGRCSSESVPLPYSRGYLLVVFYILIFFCSFLNFQRVSWSEIHMTFVIVNHQCVIMWFFVLIIEVTCINFLSVFLINFFLTVDILLMTCKVPIPKYLPTVNKNFKTNFLDVVLSSSVLTLNKYLFMWRTWVSKRYPNWKAISCHLHFWCNKFKISGWFQGWLSLWSFLGRSNEYQELARTQWLKEVLCSSYLLIIALQLNHVF